MQSRIEAFKMLAANATSWLATISSVALAKDALQILCFFASLAVSAYSIWWIRKQAKALDEKAKEQE